MKKSSFYILGIILVAVLGYIFLISGNSGKIETTEAPTTNSVGGSGEVQVVKLSVVNGNYVMDPSTIKKGSTVRMEADISKMPGCSKGVVIPSFNIRKNLNEKDNIIEFVADKSGTFNIACSMNMYRGSFTILEDDGTNPVYVEQKAQATGASCGMGANGGGCGCGG